MADSPYPELKKSHVPQRVGRPWADYKPPPSAPVWAVISTIHGFGITAAQVAGWLREAGEAGEAVVGRSGLPDKAKFPVW